MILINLLTFFFSIRPQFIERTYSEFGEHQLMRKKEKSIVLDDDEFKQYIKPVSSKKLTGNKTMNHYFELNNEFDQVTLLNQIKQDYIRKHLLNNTKSDAISSQHHSLAHNSNSLLPITTSNLNRRKHAMIEQNKLNEDAASSCFYLSRRKENKKKQPKEDKKRKVKTIHSIIKIDQDNTSNLILKKELIIQNPKLKTPLVLPPLTKNDLPKRFNKITIHDQY